MTKDSFGRLSQSYVTHVLRETRGHFNFTTDIALGLGTFDPEIRLKFPVTLASMCFSKLFTTFRLHGYHILEEKSRALEEYLCFVAEIRISYADFDQLITETFGFLLRQTTLHSRPLLLRCFKLACLCLDEPFRPSPVIKFSSVKCDDRSSKLIDVVLPVKSLFHKVPGAIQCVTSDSSIAEFLEL